MSVITVGVPGAAAAIVLWLGRRVPLTGWRKPVVIGCRLAAVAALCAALWGASHRVTHELPRRVVYLVDGSASMDAAQREWIARRIASLDALRPTMVERAVVTFGRDAKVMEPMGHAVLADPARLQRVLEQADIDRGYTNLETALLSCLPLLPAQQRGGIIVFSDGWETAGNVTGILSYLRRFGVEIFPEAVPVFGRLKTVWERLTVPPLVQRGSPVAVQLVVFNASPESKAGEITVALDGVAIKRQHVTVRSGWQVLTTSVPAIARGTMALDVRLAIPSEGVSEHRTAYTEVEGPPRVLLVEERATALPALASALKHREMELAVMPPSELPADPAKLQDNDAIILFHVPKSTLSTEQVNALRTFVHSDGGGLVTVGLGGDLTYELQHPSPLDPLLPVTFEPKGVQEAKRRVCMVMLIDRSASMYGPRIAATKRAAVELVKQLAPEDLVGVLAFDTQPYVVVEVQQAGQVAQQIIDKLVKLRSTGGTDAYPALVAAENRLNLTGATVKHVILLSDGYTPFHEKAYADLVQSLRDDGTTISTIGIGAAFINTEYMSWLANATGGTFYQMNSLDDLPRLIARDTQRALGHLPFTEGYFSPVRSPMSDWFADIPQWPPLRGYLTTTAKAGASVDLTINGGEGDDPLLARWTVGRGRVVSFVSDADTRWSPDWIRWPGFEGTWAQIVRWALRPRLTEEVFVWMDESRGNPTVIVEGLLHDPQAELTAADGVTRLPLSLIQTGTWRWQASLEQVPSGWYQLTLTSHHEDTSVAAKRWIQLGTPPASQEVTGQPPQERVLRSMAQLTQGIYPVPDRAFLPPSTMATTTEPLLTWWLPLVIILLLIEIALRGSSMV